MFEYTHINSHTHYSIQHTTDTDTHLHTHREALYPFLVRHDLNEIVEDNASPHNNDEIRLEHQRNNVRLVGYTATEEEKNHIRQLIRDQVLYTFMLSSTQCTKTNRVFFVTLIAHPCRYNIIDENKTRKHR